MAEIKAELSLKDIKFRDMTLNGSMWKSIVYVCAPLAIYQFVVQLFTILDTMIAAHIGSTSITAVTYISQIIMMLSAIGGGLSIGASIKISEAYGAGDYKLVRNRVSSVYAIIGIFSVAVLAIILPFSEKFLCFASTAPELIAEGKNYFIIQLIAIVISCFNSVYFSIERIRGNSKRILFINVIVILVKTSLSIFFIYGMDGGITHIAIATLIAQIIIFIIAMFNMHNKNNAFGFSFKAISFSRKISAPMILMSIPVMSEKLAFSFGKVIINIMSKSYGISTVGALGVSNTIGGATSSIQNGFQEGGVAIISQNMGAKKFDRAIDAFKKMLIINIIIGFVGFTLTSAFLNSISIFFAKDDIQFQRLIFHIYRYEAFGAIPLGINAAVMAFLYGLGLTKLTLALNISRVFVFRVPVLWYLQHFTNLGNESVGIVMMVSNVSVGVISAVTGIIVIKKFKNSFKL